LALNPAKDGEHFLKTLFLFTVFGFKVQYYYKWLLVFIFISEFKTQPEEKNHQYQTKNEMCIHSIPLYIAVF